MYLRLSKEDDKVKQESNSIGMQRILIHHYVEKHFFDYMLEEFIDDGYSGTNFDRPDVVRLLEKARQGEVDCIIVKDFSRFARDYIELGSYLEQIFPFLGIRFISINDKYDSDTYQGSIADLDVNFKNLLYDLYSKDLSQKVRTSLTARKAKGQYVSANSPFGYQKAPEDRHMLIIKKDEAEIVARIFDMAFQGKTISQIAKTLNEEGVKTPIEFKIEMGETSRKPKGEGFDWRSGTIAAILRNEIYVGDVVYGKTERELVGGRNVLKPRSEWKIYRNHHEAIVSREIFDEIRMTRKKTSSAKSLTSKPILQGMALCSKCKRALSYKRNKNPYFTCSTRYDKNDSECCRYINEMFLEEAVLFELEQHLMDKGLINELSKQQEEDIVAECNFLKKKIETQRKDYNIMKKLNYDNYQAYSSGSLPNFHSLTEELVQKSNDITELEAQLKELEKKLDSGNRVTVELKRDLLDRYIDCILVIDESNFEIVWKEQFEKFA